MTIYEYLERECFYFTYQGDSGWGICPSCPGREYIDGMSPWEPRGMPEIKWKRKKYGEDVACIFPAQIFHHFDLNQLPFYTILLMIDIIHNWYNSLSVFENLQVIFKNKIFQGKVSHKLEWFEITNRLQVNGLFSSYSAKSQSNNNLPP